MTEPEHHENHEHHVTHNRFDELKAEYCRRCGLPISPGEAHEHDDEGVAEHDRGE
ncbi:hypothetical protein [Agromyces sp. Marseille-Q5079]|uniref:hypothetical protein n=1 Tax=Agromyces sp. Marseille-Q5079 TaxID=3439059 RepID=UPI003D9CAC07